MRNCNWRSRYGSRVSYGVLLTYAFGNRPSTVYPAIRENGGGCLPSHDTIGSHTLPAWRPPSLLVRLPLTPVAAAALPLLLLACGSRSNLLKSVLGPLLMKGCCRSNPDRNGQGVQTDRQQQTMSAENRHSPSSSSTVVGCPLLMKGCCRSKPDRNTQATDKKHTEDRQNRSIISREQTQSI